LYRKYRGANQAGKEVGFSKKMVTNLKALNKVKHNILYYNYL